MGFYGKHRKLVDTRMGNSIASRLIVLLAAVATVIIAAGMLLDYRLSRAQILEGLTEQAVVETQLVIGDMENWLNGVEATTRLLAQVLQQREYSNAELRQMLRDAVAHNDNIFGAAIALDPALTDEHAGFAPYYYKTDGQVRYADLSSRKARYTEQPWFTEPVASRAAIWTEPYFDAGGGELNMTSFSVPVYRADSDGNLVFYAVVTADVTLEALHQALQRLHLGASSHGLLFSRQGILMSSPDPESAMQHYSELRYGELDPDTWQQMFQRALQGESTANEFSCTGQSGRCTIRLGRLGTAGWPVGIGYQLDEVLAPLQSYQIKTALVTGVTLALVIFAVYAVTSRLTKPLSQLTRATEDMAKGRLDTPLPRAKGKDEVASLVNSFSSMSRELKTYITDLEAATATRSRMEGELAAAWDIQMSMLPQGGNALLKAGAVDLWAQVTPARTVGGDLYTYYQRGTQLFMAVGDVSDKGVPAALFMARAISLIQQLAGTATPPGEAMEALNNALERDNSNCMFVTLFLGVLDTRSGLLQFASAGHPAPSLLRDGNVHVQQQTTGPALGLAKDQYYPVNSLQLQRGDRLAIYTDGVDEAFNTADEMYGVERLNAALLGTVDNAIDDAGHALFASVAAHAAGRTQSDDITLLLLDFDRTNARFESKEFDPAETALITEVHAWLTPLLDAAEVPDEARHDVKLVAEEMVTNIQQHANAPRGKPIEVTLAHNPLGWNLETRDRGEPFNPLVDTKRAALGEHIASAEPGGLGVHLITLLTDRQQYQRADGVNILRVEKSYP